MKEEPIRKEPTGQKNRYVGMIGGKSPKGLNFSNLGPQSCGNGWDLRMGGVWQQAYLENLYICDISLFVVHFNPFWALTRYAIYHQKVSKKLTSKVKNVL